MAAKRDKRGASRGPNTSASDAPRVVYSPNPGTTPEDEARALAAVYVYLLERRKQGEPAAEAGRGEDATGGGPGGASSGEATAGGAG